MFPLTVWLDRLTLMSGLCFHSVRSCKYAHTCFYGYFLFTETYPHNFITFIYSWKQANQLPSRNSNMRGSIQAMNPTDFYNFL